MSERARNWVIIGALVLMAGFLAMTVSTDPANSDRTQAIGSQIKCPVCQGESIADSPAPMARDMMALVSERVAAGVGDDEIIEELLGSYTGALLLDPPTSGNTLALWLAPLAALIVGAGVIMWWKRHPGEVADEEEPGEKGRGRGRLIAGGAVLIGSLVVIVVAASGSIQDSQSAAEGIAGLASEDLAEVSNETLEAVVAANAEHPQINGMRLALADRYYDSGDYRSAFPHYLAVAENTTSDPEALTALSRLAWMAYDGNGDVDTATGLLQEALEIDPDSQVALYLMGTVRWCGAGENDVAVELFSRVLDSPDLPSESRAQVEADYAAASQGESCS